MTDTSELVRRLRISQDFMEREFGADNPQAIELKDAADALEAQAREIEQISEDNINMAAVIEDQKREIERLRERRRSVTNNYDRALDKIAELEASNRALREALQTIQREANLDACPAALDALRALDEPATATTPTPLHKAAKRVLDSYFCENCEGLMEEMRRLERALDADGGEGE